MIIINVGVNSHILSLMMQISLSIRRLTLLNSMLILLSLS